MSPLLLLSIALLAAGCPPAQAEKAVSVDRSPLTFRDSGLYCNLSGFVTSSDTTREGVPDLLTRDRALRPETPWDFFIAQYNAAEPSPQLAATIQRFARHGKKLILRVLLGKQKNKVDPATAKQRLRALFRHVNPAWVYAITLDEENVYWLGNTKTLTDLYHWTKQQWPDLPVYQWWTPMVAPEVGATSGWVALPADGWVLDLYGQPAEAFEKKLLRFLETGKPAVHIAWASPTWVFYNKNGHAKEGWWEGAGREVFTDQLRICREYNVPVAYFCCQQAEVVAGKRVAPIRWAWQAVEPATRHWFQELEALVANFDFLPPESIGFRQPTPKLLAWAHASPVVTVHVALDDHDRKRFSWRTGFPAIDSSPGTHVVPRPYRNPFVKLAYTVETGASFLQAGFGVPSIAGRGLSVPLTFRITPLQPATDWVVRAQVIALPELGGSVRLQVSADGKNWSTPVTTRRDAGHRQTLEQSLTPAKGTPPDGLWARLTLGANAGVKTGIAARLTALEVSASLTPAP